MVQLVDICNISNFYENEQRKMSAIQKVFILVVVTFLITGADSFPAKVTKFQKRSIQNDASRNEILYHVEDTESKNEEPPTMFNTLKDLPNIKKFIKNTGGKVLSFAECFSCKFAVGFIQHFVRTGATEDDIGNLAYRVCTMLSIETPRVCAGVSKMFKRELTQVIATVILNPEQICNIVYKGCGEPFNPLHHWTVPLTPFPKPPVKPPLPPKPQSPTLRVLHISDVHIDFHYKEGSNANCGEPLCCRQSSGKPDNPKDAAGYWGDYRNCDIPFHTFENMLRHINETQKFDYVIWTGDIPPHDIWNNSRKEAIELLHTACKTVHKYLGHVPIYPALGNHEASPVNSFPIPEIKGNGSISWLYDEVAKAWSSFLPGNINTLKLGAYYTHLISPGFRIISLNMNYCNNLNLWLLINTTDPTGQLSWLVAQLQMAEVKGEKVHIIGHIPPGEPDCLGVWSSNYYRIVNRYENTIAAQFFGHTHTDEFEIFYDKSSPILRPTSIAYVGPSVTTYDGINPGYRIYTVDGDYPSSSRVVLDHETYITNLTEANMYKKAKWVLEYTAKAAYNMTSLLPEEWHRLTERFEEDDELFHMFHNYLIKMSDFTFPYCDDVCKKIIICKLRRGQSNDPLVC